MQTMNNIGPSTVPWETPSCTNLPLNLTYYSCLTIIKLCALSPNLLMTEMITINVCSAQLKNYILKQKYSFVLGTTCILENKKPREITKRNNLYIF